MSVRGFFGGLLMVIGWLVTLLAGGCSLIFSIISFAQGGFDLLAVVIPVGGISFLFGLGLIALGEGINGDASQESKDYRNPYARPEDMHKLQQERDKCLKEDNVLIDEEKLFDDDV